MTNNQQKIAAFSDAISRALDYGEEGLKLAVQILQNEKGQVKLAMYNLLWENLDDLRRKQLWQYLVNIQETKNNKSAG
ncbi:MAG: hypothetical protein QNJ55_26460 [Xenococcus sp. MO_188.B8]|nr:hypothetical protein [Xenococcus sp. MO_188.B8]